MRSAEGLVVLKRFLLIFSDLILDSKVDPGNPNISSDGSSSTDTFEFKFLQNTQESDLRLNSALKCDLSKRMPFEWEKHRGIDYR